MLSVLVFSSHLDECVTDNKRQYRTRFSKDHWFESGIDYIPDEVSLNVELCG